MPTLDDILPGASCEILSLKARGQLGQRLMNMGFFPGTRLTVVRNAPLVDPVDIEMDGCHVSIRHDEAKHVEVAPA
ncbi:FeoA family protein [Desulfocurvus sp. DL9XJH121]